MAEALKVFVEADSTKKKRLLEKLLKPVRLALVTVHGGFSTPPSPITALAGPSTAGTKLAYYTS